MAITRIRIEAEGETPDLVRTQMREAMAVAIEEIGKPEEEWYCSADYVTPCGRSGKLWYEGRFVMKLKVADNV